MKKRPFLRIPIVLSHEKPCVSATIEGRKLLFQLDSGASDCFTMHQKILEEIKKKKLLEIKPWYDVQGNRYNSPRYVIEKIDIDTFEISNATATEEDLNFLSKGSKIFNISSNEKILGELADISGRLGARTLRVLNYWLLDLPHQTLVAIRDIEKIKDTPGFSFNGFVEVPLEKISPQIVISVETIMGKKNLALDTGASHSILSPTSPEYFDHQTLTMDQLFIGGKDFGKMEFYLFQMPPQFAFDGVLGRDFLEKHAVYLDFKKNRAFIGPSSQPNRSLF